MDQPFKFIIIGSGNIARTYNSVIKEIDNMETVGLVSRSLNKPSWLEDDNNEVKKSVKEITTDFDAVILATPNGMHHTGARQAAPMGKHVLTEKPLDITVDAMNSMIKVCRENNVKLGITYQRRTSPDNKIIHDLIKQGKLGNIFAADATVKNYRDEEYYGGDSYRGTWQTDGGGPFMMQAIHHIDLYGWFFGKPEKVVSSYDTFTHNIEVEDYGTAILRHKDGMIGTITASTSTKPGFESRLEIHSDKGTVILENDAITFWEMQGLENPSQSLESEVHSGATNASVSNTAGHEKIVKDFVEAVREDREPLVDGESAKLATEIVLQIYGNNVFNG